MNGWELIPQLDGNFVIYNPSTSPVWASRTDVGHALSDVMQADGNFVIYDGGTVRWASSTDGHSGAYLCFQTDGNMVIYALGGYTCTGHVLWASGT